MMQSTSTKISFQLVLRLISLTNTYSISVFFENELVVFTVARICLPDFDNFLHRDFPINPDDPVIKIFFNKFSFLKID